MKLINPAKLFFPGKEKLRYSEKKNEEMFYHEACPTRKTEESPHLL